MPSDGVVFRDANRGLQDRRDFIKSTSVTAVAAGLAANCSSGKVPAVPTVGHYQAEVPDTLDLADRGACCDPLDVGLRHGKQCTVDHRHQGQNHDWRSEGGEVVR